MEEARNYIETGILELYVLGDVTPEERQQVEQMMAQHPSIKAEVAEIERAMESYAAVNAVAPSEKQRDKILNSLLINLGDDRTFTSKSIKAVDNVIAMHNPKANNFYKYAFAASVALLIASVVALYNMHNQLEASNTQLAVLTTQNQHISSTVSMQDNALGVYRDTTYKVIRLKGTPKAADARMSVAWSPVKKKVIIDMANLNMPENDKEHQYQLWALVAGKPVDLGVFDKNAGDTVNMKEMKSIGTADAFAVTLEPRGGSINPTMSELMVVGANSK